MRVRKSKRRTARIVLLCVALLAAVGCVALSIHFWGKGNAPENKDDAGNATMKDNQQPDDKKAEDNIKPEDEKQTPAEDKKTEEPTDPDKNKETLGPVAPPEKETYESIGSVIDMSSLSQEYQKKYMGLYAPPAEIVPTEDKVVYLTFDDGPSANTPAVLDELDKYGVKATFFVVTGNKNEETTKEMLNEILSRGHQIGIHTFSHDYKAIYASVDAFLADLDKVNQFVYEATGIRPSIYRFPGGSLNNFNKAVVHDIMTEMARRGFTVYDWNSSTQDAEGKGFDSQQLADNAISTFSGRQRVIILTHDGGGQKKTPAAIGPIVEYAKANGYRFATLDNTVKEVTFVKKQ